jgi:hypothetical protein
MKKLIIVLVTFAIIGLTSCEKWLDINKNPNDATSATPDLILPGVLTTWGSDINGLQTTTGAWMGYWAHAGGWSGWYTTKKYEVTTGFYPGAFNGYYIGNLVDTKFIRDNCGTNLVYPAITHVVDAWYYSRLVDLYGDVPYTEACNPSLTITPKFDNDADIYAALLVRLDTAINVFNRKANGLFPAANAGDYTFVTAGDVIFAGDFSKWMKFANTLKLRLILRETNVKTAAELQAKMATTESKGFIAADVNVNPGYTASSGKTNPLWNNFGKTYAGVNQDANTQYCLNSYFHRKLNILADPRLTQYFFAGVSAGGTLRSMLLGTDGDLTAQPNTTIVGNYSWIPIASNAVAGSNGTATTGATDAQKLFLYSEACFLRAEGLVRGILTGAAGDEIIQYRAGITKSMNDAKITTASTISDYYTQTTVDFASGAPTAEKISKIINQKYIANYFFNTFESYCDYRRTGYPNPKHPGVVIDAVNDPNFEMLSYYPSGIIRRQIPRLFPYPNEEFTLNLENVQAAVDLQGVAFTTSAYPFDARVFWDTAPTTIDYNY